MKKLLFIGWMAATLALAGAEENPKFLLTFETYPPDALWFEPVKRGQPGRVPLQVSSDEIKRGKQLELSFTAPHFKRFNPQELSLDNLSDGKGGVKDPDGDGRLVWPKLITLEPENAWWGFFYSLNSQRQSVLLGGLVAAGALAFGWSRQQSSRKLQSYQNQLELLARQAGHRGDPLVSAQKELGPYKVVDKLGEGGMATVYRAVPSATLNEKEAVAIKLMRAELTNPEDRKRFIREINTVRNLKHPNIVRLEYQGETEDEELFMAMELIEGKPLEIPSQGLPLERVTQLLEPMVQALSYAHSQGVVHRDLKPANVMVTQDNQVKIMDFGLARSHDASKVTRTGTVLGSPAYVSPEQLGGGELDARSDQYSLGASLYEMLTGGVPFPRADTMASLMAHLLELPDSLRELRPELPPSIDRVVRRTLEKNPALRYPNLEAMLVAWREAVQNPDAFDGWKPSPVAAQVSEQPLNVSDEAGDETLC